MNTEQIVKRYQAGESMNRIAADLGRNQYWVKRVLVGEGAIEYSHPKEDQIRELRAQGMGAGAIAKKLGIGTNPVCMVLGLRHGNAKRAAWGSKKKGPHR